MLSGSLVEIPADRESDFSLLAHPRYSLGYSYHRSWDARQSQQLGQDALAFLNDDSKVVFAICDGVGQSFLGHLAARFLAPRLVSFLWSLDTAACDEPSLMRQTREMLESQQQELRAMVEAAELSPDLLCSVKAVLEELRAGSGSETTFAAARVDSEGGEHTLSMLWAGDTRLRWLAPDEGYLSELNQGRYNSLTGLTEPLRVGRFRLRAPLEVYGYSDGLADFDKAPWGLTRTEIAQQTRGVSEQTDCDDLSLFWLRSDSTGGE